MPSGALPATTVVPVPVPGTAETGTLSYLGSVNRIPVVPLLPGRSSVAVPLPGTRAYASVVPIAYRQAGSGAPLLLIEGQGASMDWWSPGLLQLLAQHYRVTLFDLPGVGYSGPSHRSISFSYLADLTAGLSNELGLQSPVLVGWGMGAQIALALIERHPSLAVEAVLVDSGLPTPGSIAPRGLAQRLLASPLATPAAISGVMFPAAAASARHAWLRQLAAQVPDNLTSGAIGTEASLEARLWHGNGIVRDLGSVHLPVLVIGGSADVVFPLFDTVALSSAIPGSQRYVWKGTGYAGLVQEPSKFLTILQDFTG
ncbi:MAG: alpha/beta fold hydrolase [Acidimicrobiales bacterium]